jgi:hypothetical protein
MINPCASQDDSTKPSVFELMRLMFRDRPRSCSVEALEGPRIEGVQALHVMHSQT